jgi:6-phospho-3-hexuloisomerase
MDQVTDLKEVKTIEENLQLILSEQLALAQRIDFNQVQMVLSFINKADRIFVIGAGRSGLAMRSAAMRLMHLGLTVHVVGDTTTPAIRKGDLLIAASGSGTTNGIVAAVSVGATVIAFSTNTESPLARLSALVMVLPAAQKQDISHVISAQYAGSLFEQAVLLLTDAIFQTLWKASGIAGEELWKQHANLE